ncbi:hypothetical protein D9611_003220 [Ephemerocybe angulata]|uniref:Anti-proliferative protein domain-containing protein n=1 Tax=Ephemerocybe angulata TaxID=980116 RepID=A0A8H5C8X6_9AGAR|nr:hypothetical protein D9611_003220 [Tulosesus angulatus]
MSSTNLTVTLAHAIAYLTAPLLTSYNAAVIVKLQSLLDANLTALYAPTWSVKDPLRGSTRRCLVLSPECLPPRPIYQACVSAGVQWFDWIDALGGFEFELYVDPGCVAVRRAAGKLTTVWTGAVAAPPLPTPRTGLASFSDAQNRAMSPNKTVAQQLLEDDDEDEKIFDLINDANWGPTFPNARSSSPLSTLSSAYSRCSSRSSNSSSSASDGAYSNSSSPPSSTYSSSKGSSTSSRRDKAKQARVYIDTTKTDVTPYDGGKTTVLTGGVMLGGGPVKATSHKSKPSASSWRSVRA